jgi:hypothetical protein
MTELEKVWQDIDRDIGYIQGFTPAIYALAEMKTTGYSCDAVTTEQIVKYEDVVEDLATKTARLRELVSGEVVTQ